MKFLVIILLGIALHGNTSDTYAWDSTAANFYPLSIGNRWVYNHHWYWSGVTKISVNVIDTLTSNGHLYYKLRSQIPPPGSGFSETFVRVDSVTGSIRYLVSQGSSCSWLINESTGDSLNASELDTFYVSCIGSWKLSNDTNINYFGLVRRIRSFSDNPPPPNWSKYGRSYVQGIGKVTDGLWYQPGVTNWIDLVGCVINGNLFGDTNTFVGINQINSEIPKTFELSQNYPNPFNPVTRIKFQIPLSRGVPEGRGVLTQLSIYDALGKEVAVLVNQNLQPGTYEADWDASAYPSGVYYYKLEVSPSTGSGRGFTETKKMVLIK